MKQWEHLHLVLAYHLAYNEKQMYMYTHCTIIASHAPHYYKENHKSIIGSWWRLILKHMLVKKIFWPKREKATRDCRKLYNEKLHDLYSSPNIIWLITARCVCERPVNRHTWGWRKCKQGYGRTHHLQDLVKDRGIILKCILKKKMVGHGMQHVYVL